MTPDDIIAAARECLDTPFRHQGRIVGVGIDCAGVICHVAHRLGLQYDAPTNYPRDPYQGLLEATLDAQDCLQRIDHPEPGAVLLMRTNREPRHLGIWSGATLIHADETIGKVCEHRMDAVWLRRVVRSYRFVSQA